MPRLSARAMAPGRQSVDTSLLALSFGMPQVILPPLSADQDWRLQNLDSQTLDRIEPMRLLEMLSDLSPDVSRALFDWLRLLNPGWTVEAFNPGGETPNVRAQAIVDGFLDRLADTYGAVDVLIGRLMISGYLRGAFMAELVMADNGRDAVDLATPDPATARFRRIVDPVRGDVWQLGQYQGAKFVPLDRPTVRYLPIDSFPGSPYGRAPAAAGLFSTLFLIGLMHDLRRVVAQQGYPRLDIAVLFEKLTELMPADLRDDPEAFETWVSSAITEIKDTYASLKPDDAYIHLDMIEMNRPVGTVSADALGAIDGLIQALERMSVRALKTAPFMMGVQESTTETQSNRQWEAMLQNVKALQHLCEQLLEYLLRLAVQAQGIQAVVRFRFAENRASEMFRDQQTRAILIDNTTREYLMGWIDQKEAAQRVTGHAPALPEPLAVPAGYGPVNEAPDTTTNPEPGETKAPLTTFQRWRPSGAGLPLAPVPDMDFTLRDGQTLLDGWDEANPDHAGLLDAAVTNEPAA